MFNSTNGTNGANTSVPLWVRVDNVLKHDKEKSELLQEVLQRYEYLSQQYKKEAEERASERDLVVNFETIKKNLEDTIRHYELFMQRDPFVIILIDADGMVFQDELFRHGEAGGKAAATRLHDAVTEHIQLYMPNVPSHTKVVCRVYANVRGLADVLVRIGVVDEIGPVEEFARAFTRTRKLFDLVDVGAGKDRADDKLIETFKLYLHDYHCRHIFFGCSHDNGYARVLEEHATDQRYVDRITMLEGVPFEKELLTLPFKTLKFHDLFREKKLNEWANRTTYGNGMPPMPLNGLPSRFPAPSRTTSGLLFRTSPPTATSTPAGFALDRTPSASTLGSMDAFSSLPQGALVATSWASKAAAPPPPKLPSPPSTIRVSPRDEVISRNRTGQRVDPQTRSYDKNEVDRVKRIKMCNVHFLRRECPFGNECTHFHDYKPTLAEIETLRLVARMAPCQNGSACQDVKCIYGHRCPAPEAKNAVKGTKTCIFGDKCKFPVELHGLDCNVVKTLTLCLRG